MYVNYSKQFDFHVIIKCVQKYTSLIIYLFTVQDFKRELEPAEQVISTSWWLSVTRFDYNRA